MRTKPGQWNVNRALVDPRYRGLWDGLEILVPFWERSGAPRAWVRHLGGWVTMTEVGTSPPRRATPIGSGVAYTDVGQAAYLTLPATVFGWPDGPLTLLYAGDEGPGSGGYVISLADDDSSTVDYVGIGVSTSFGTRAIRQGSGHNEFTAFHPWGPSAIVRAMQGIPSDYSENWAEGAFRSSNQDDETFSAATTLSFAIGAPVQGGSITIDDAGAGMAFAAVWSRVLRASEHALLGHDPTGMVRRARRMWVLAPEVLGASLAVSHYRWRNDDDTEADATWAQDEDTADTVAAGERRRLRFQVEGVEDGAYTLQAAPVGGEDWADVGVEV